MSITRTFIAAAALAAALPFAAHAGLVGQGTQQYMTIGGTVGGGNAGIQPNVVGSQVEFSQANLHPIMFANLLGDSSFTFDWTDDRLTVEYASGTTGKVTEISYAISLLDPNSRFTSLWTEFDNFGSHSSNGWTATLLSPSTLAFSVAGMAIGSVQNSYSTSAQFGFTIETVTANPPPGGNDVPEPASLALVGAALAGLAASRRPRRLR